MPLFVMIAHDGPAGAERRAQQREQHVAFWSDLDRVGRVALAGPIRSDDNERSIRAVIVFDAADLPTARALVARDPYVTAGVFASLAIAPFRRVFPGLP